MISIPKFAQSSIDPEQVSLTISSVGKAVAGLITVLGMIGLVDPVIATQTWGNFVASVITAVPAGYAVWHTGYAVWGIIRKIAVRITGFFQKNPVTIAPAEAQL